MAHALAENKELVSPKLFRESRVEATAEALNMGNHSDESPASNLILVVRPVPVREIFFTTIRPSKDGGSLPQGVLNCENSQNVSPTFARPAAPDDFGTE